MHYPAVLSVVISILITREMEETFGKIEGSKERLREKETERERESALLVLPLMLQLYLFVSWIHSPLSLI